jgi:hypothetical protein
VSENRLCIFGWYFQTLPEIYGNTLGYLMRDILDRDIFMRDILDTLGYLMRDILDTLGYLIRDIFGVLIVIPTVCVKIKALLVLTSLNHPALSHVGHAL